MQVELTKAQNAIENDRHRFRVVVCGRKFGKSTVSIYDMLACAVTGNRLIVYFATTYGEARDILWAKLKETCKGAIIKINETNMEVTIRNNIGGTSTITLRGMETVERVRGLEFDLMVLDEVQNYKNFWTTWYEVLRPTLTPRKGQCLIIGTPKGYNHLYDLSQMPDKDPNFSYHHYTTYDNPHIDIEEIEEAKRQLPDVKFAQEYLAEFKKMEGLVYPMFDRFVHTFDDQKLEYLNLRYKDATWYAGVDFGWTNPTAILKVVKDNDDNFYVTEEWVHTGKTNAEMIEYAKTMNINLFYPDPAEPDRIREMQNAGMTVRAVNKDIDAGIDAVRNLLKNKKLFIYEGCVNTLAEFESYAYEDNKRELNDKEKPIDANNHCMDALRYVIFMLSTVLQKKGPVVHYSSGMKAGYSLNPTVSANQAKIHLPLVNLKQESITPKKKPF